MLNKENYDSLEKYFWETIRIYRQYLEMKWFT